MMIYPHHMRMYANSINRLVLGGTIIGECVCAVCVTREVKCVAALYNVYIVNRRQISQRQKEAILLDTCVVTGTHISNLPSLLTAMCVRVRVSEYK